MKKSQNSQIPHDLGVAVTDNKVFIYFNLHGRSENAFRMGVSNDGFYFKTHSQTPQILDEKAKPLSSSLNFCSFTKLNENQFAMVYSRINGKGQKTQYLATSKDMVTWNLKEQLMVREKEIIVPQFQDKNRYMLLFGERDIKIAWSFDFVHFETKEEPVLSPRQNYFDKYPLEVLSAITLESEIVVLYCAKNQKREGIHYYIGAAVLDKKDPQRVIWRSIPPLWEQPEVWDGLQIFPLGAIKFKGKLILYFSSKKGIFAVTHPTFSELFDIKKLLSSPVLEKVPQNPIITPVMSNPWESQATFNSAAVFEKDKVHFLYRAVGNDNTSVLGYASSSDGVNVDERFNEPAYVPTQPFELPWGQPLRRYMSGGGYGGCEDPRVTKIDERFYLTYVAFDGCNPPRVALSSILEDDFHNKRWDKWEKPKLISKPGVVDKNCVIFPQKIKGKYVVLHRVFPNILIDFVDSLDFKDNEYLKGEFSIAPRQNFWDSRKIGAGSPPIWTKDGWLLIYHAVDDRDAGSYKIGAMLLDLQNPRKVLYWSVNPILTPTHWYENEGYKAGVAYPCGAIIKDNTLYVYYGGADTVVCVARKNLSEFLEMLKVSSKVSPEETIRPHRVSYLTA